ncbi:MAG TPA: indolepyruvate oxidoreductase subunit beta [Clostridiales bacterium]|jgi:indolepyruvate ferredoxin oxidoreductase beta subunit|nr:indolepyruvate oxidoreductase subunit beta [Clostridiales bacterium]
MSQVKNILLVGVGGQGTILAARILSVGLTKAGYDVKMSEIHGMSQRGGNVSTQIRFGEKVYSPVIAKGEADLIVAFEKMEALRWVEYLKPGGKMVVNDLEIPSAPIQQGAEKYPRAILETLAECSDLKVFKATDIAGRLGNVRSTNIVLLGALAAALDLPEIDWETIIREQVKPAFAELNVSAFRAGRAEVEQQ